MEPMEVVSSGNDLDVDADDGISTSNIMNHIPGAPGGNHGEPGIGSDSIFANSVVNAAVVASKAAVMASALSAMAAIVAVDAMADDVSFSASSCGTEETGSTPSAPRLALTCSPQWDTPGMFPDERHRLFPGPSPWPPEKSFLATPVEPVEAQMSEPEESNSNNEPETDSAMNAEGNEKPPSTSVPKSKRIGTRGKTPSSWKQSWRPTCEGERCHKSPCFGYPGKKAVHCVQHKKEGMINVRRAKCKHEECLKAPTQGFAGDRKAEYCADHRLPGMFDISKPIGCKYPGGCARAATHAFPANPNSPPSSTAPEKGSSESSGSSDAAVGSETAPSSDIGSGASTLHGKDNTEVGISVSSTNVATSDNGALEQVGQDAEGATGTHAEVEARPDATRDMAHMLRPKFCSEHAAPGMVEIIPSGIGIGEFGSPVKLEEDGIGIKGSKRRTASRSPGWLANNANAGNVNANGDDQRRRGGMDEDHVDVAVHPDSQRTPGNDADVGIAIEGGGSDTGNAAKRLNGKGGGAAAAGEGAGLLGKAPTGSTRWTGKEKGVVSQCPHTNSKHYCHGMCKLCYMKDYNRRTRLAIQNGQCGQGASADKQDEGSTKVASPCGTQEPARVISTSSVSQGDASGSQGVATLEPGSRGLRKRQLPGASPNASGAVPAESAASAVKPRSGTQPAKDPAPRGWRKQVVNCHHPNSPHYGKGFCRPCYMKEYNRTKKTGGVVERLRQPPIGSSCDADTGKQSLPPPPPPPVSSSSQPSGVISSLSLSGKGPTSVGKSPGASRSATLVQGPAPLPSPLCFECGQTEKSWAVVLICDGCDATYHLGCAGLSDQPPGEWFCKRCSEILLDTDSETSDVEASPPKSKTANGASSDPTHLPSTLVSSASELGRMLGNPNLQSGKAGVNGDARGAAPPTPESSKGCDAGSSRSAGGSIAVGWQTPRPVSMSTSSATKVAVDHRKPRGIPADGKWSLTGDVRGCRCPDCVSILLQCGGKRPGTARAMFSSVERKALPSVAPASQTTASKLARANSDPFPLGSSSPKVSMLSSTLPSQSSMSSGSNVVTSTTSDTTRNRELSPNDGNVSTPNGSSVTKQLPPKSESTVSVGFGSVKTPAASKRGLTLRAAGGETDGRTRAPAGRRKGSRRGMGEEQSGVGASGESGVMLQRFVVRAGRTVADGNVPTGPTGSTSVEDTNGELSKAIRMKNSLSVQYESEKSSWVTNDGSGEIRGGVGGGESNGESSLTSGNISSSSGGANSGGDDGRGLGRTPAVRRKTKTAAASVQVGATSRGGSRRGTSLPTSFLSSTTQAMMTSIARGEVASGGHVESASNSRENMASETQGTTFAGPARSEVLIQSPPWLEDPPVAMEDIKDNGVGARAAEEQGVGKRRLQQGESNKYRISAISASVTASRKGKVTHCPHVDRAMYSRGQCKQCYMVAYWKRKHEALGIAPRKPRSPSWGDKKKTKEDSRSGKRARREAGGPEMFDSLGEVNSEYSASNEPASLGGTLVDGHPCEETDIAEREGDSLDGHSFSPHSDVSLPSVGVRMTSGVLNVTEGEAAPAETSIEATDAVGPDSNSESVQAPGACSGRPLKKLQSMSGAEKGQSICAAATRGVGQEASALILTRAVASPSAARTLDSAAGVVSLPTAKVGGMNDGSVNGNNRVKRTGIAVNINGENGVAQARRQDVMEIETHGASVLQSGVMSHPSQNVAAGAGRTNPASANGVKGGLGEIAGIKSIPVAGRPSTPKHGSN